MERSRSFALQGGSAIRFMYDQTTETTLNKKLEDVLSGILQLRD
ncbi:MAG: hypothetical protein P8H56_13950 [Crocinitomicaceae bacterium]|jgi:hypothetical protein|nr:hypothetical protein [Crocinitomicaceae bacterium]MDG1659677.1 hypothetical protein [Crocinitomicaceae bacterium]